MIVALSPSGVGRIRSAIATMRRSVRALPGIGRHRRRVAIVVIYWYA